MSLARYEGELPIPKEALAQALEKEERRVSALRRQREYHELQRARDASSGIVVNGSSEGALHIDHHRKPGSTERRTAYDLTNGADYEDGKVEVSGKAERSWAFGVREDYSLGDADYRVLSMEADFEELAQLPGLPPLAYRLSRAVQEAVDEEIEVFESSLTAVDLRG